MTKVPGGNTKKGGEWLLTGWSTTKRVWEWWRFWPPDSFSWRTPTFWRLRTSKRTSNAAKFAKVSEILWVGIWSCTLFWRSSPLREILFPTLRERSWATWLRARHFTVILSRPLYICKKILNKTKKWCLLLRQRDIWNWLKAISLYNWNILLIIRGPRNTQPSMRECKRSTTHSHQTRRPKTFPRSSSSRSSCTRKG